jgi:uncharacterized phage protein (TIGR01671 family)
VDCCGDGYCGCNKESWCVMREIKFRAWIKAQKRMILVDMIDFTYRKVYEFLYEDQGSISGNKAYSFEEVELMQYTGQWISYEVSHEDHIKEEIYEGDVFEWLAGPSSTWHKGVVRWSDETSDYWVDGTDKENESLFHYISEYSVHIISGNIYQNPELIPVEVVHG